MVFFRYTGRKEERAMEQPEKKKKIVFILALFAAMAGLLFMSVMFVKEHNSEKEAENRQVTSVSDQSDTVGTAQENADTSDEDSNVSLIKHYGVGILFGAMFLAGIFLAIFSKRKELNALADEHF